MKFTFLCALALVNSVDAQAAAPAKAAPAAPAKAAPAAPAKAAPVAAPAAAAPAPAKKRGLHSKKFREHTHRTPRPEIRRAKIAWNDDNSKYPQKHQALPKSFGLEHKRYVSGTKNTHHRIIEKEASKKTGRIPQFPHDITRTSHRETFRRSDLDRRAINVQEICAGYSNQKERDACQKRYGVYTEKTHANHKSAIEMARQRCDVIPQANRRRMCFNTYLRKGTVPYFAQQNEDQDDEVENNEEAIDAGEESGEEEEENQNGLAQTQENEDGDDDEDEEEDDGLMQVAEDDDESEDEDDDDDLAQVNQEGDDDDDSDDDE